MTDLRDRLIEEQTLRRRIRDLEDEIRVLEDDNLDLERELKRDFQWRENYRELVELLRDVERGIRTFEEVMASL